MCYSGKGLVNDNGIILAVLGEDAEHLDRPLEMRPRSRLAPMLSGPEGEA